MRDDTPASLEHVRGSVNYDQPKLLPYATTKGASDEASYISGAIVPVTGGKPIL